MTETIAIFKRNNYTFTIEKHSKGYYNLTMEKQGSVEVISSPDLSELIGKCFDEVEGKSQFPPSN